MYQGYRIIDSHTHTYPELIAQKATQNLGKFYDFQVDGAGTYNALEEEARQAGVDGFLLFCVATNAHQVGKLNDTIISLVKESRAHGFETYGFAGMHQDYPDFEGEINRIADAGLYGVKMHPDIQGVDVDSPNLFPLYEIMEKKGLRLFLHAGDDRPQYRFSEPKKIAGVAKMFPNMKIVAAHLGGYKAWDEAREYLYGLDNLWYDCSSALWAMSAERAEELVRGCGTKRVMFGSDYPVVHLKDYIELFMKINLTSEERRDIFCDNCRRFLDLTAD